MNKTSRILILLVLLILTICFLTLVWGIRNSSWLSDLDESIMLQVYTLRSPRLNSFMTWYTDFVSHFVMTIFSIGFVLLSLYKKKFEHLMHYTFTFGFSILLSLLLKNIIQRNRPSLSPLMIEESFSFPSGHSMNSYVFYITLSILVCWIFRDRKIWIPFLLFSLLISFSIAFSRIYLGVHYPTDIVGAYIAGSFVLIISSVVLFYRVRIQNMLKLLLNTL